MNRQSATATATFECNEVEIVAYGWKAEESRKLRKAVSCDDITENTLYQTGGDAEGLKPGPATLEQTQKHTHAGGGHTLIVAGATGGGRNLRDPLNGKPHIVGHLTPPERESRDGVTASVGVALGGAEEHDPK